MVYKHGHMNIEEIESSIDTIQQLCITISKQIQHNQQRRNRLLKHQYRLEALRDAYYAAQQKVPQPERPEDK